MSVFSVDRRIAVIVLLPLACGCGGRIRTDEGELVDSGVVDSGVVDSGGGDACSVLASATIDGPIDGRSFTASGAYATHGLNDAWTVVVTDRASACTAPPNPLRSSRSIQFEFRGHGPPPAGVYPVTNLQPPSMWTVRAGGYRDDCTGYYDVATAGSLTVSRSDACGTTISELDLTFNYPPLPQYRVKGSVSAPACSPVPSEQICR